MKPTAAWLVAASITTLTIVATSSLHGASQQVWNPQVARAAKVTVNLLKGNMINPVQLARKTRTNARFTSALPGLTPSNELIGYTLNQHLAITYTPNPLGKLTHPTSSLRKPFTPAPSKPSVSTSGALIEESALNRSTFQNWDGSVEGKLRQQKYHIKKLELELAKEHYKDGTVGQATFDQKAEEYRLASQEFKAFLDSSKMAN